MAYAGKSGQFIIPTATTPKSWRRTKQRMLTSAKSKRKRQGGNWMTQAAVEAKGSGLAKCENVRG